MRSILAVLVVVLTTVMPATAQAQGVAPACEFEPTRACVLALLRETALAPSPRDDDIQGLRRRVAVLAARAGDLETATAMRDLTTDFSRVSADMGIARAHALAGRVEDVLRIADEYPSDAPPYGRLLAIATTMAGREAELDALLARLPGPVPAIEALVGRVVADLVAGNAAAATARLEAAQQDMRGEAALFAAVDLIDHETPALAAPLPPFVEPRLRPSIAAWIAAARGDIAAARLASKEAASDPRIAREIATPLIQAFARGGEVDDALAIARAAPAPFPRIRNLADVARLGRSDEALGDLEAAVAAARRGEQAVDAEAMLVLTLAAIGRAADAERRVGAHAGQARTQLLTALIDGLAQGGRADRAVIYARGLADPVARGYALVAVHEALER